MAKNPHRTVDLKWLRQWLRSQGKDTGGPLYITSDRSRMLDDCVYEEVPGGIFVGWPKGDSGGEKR